MEAAGLVPVVLSRGMRLQAAAFLPDIAAVLTVSEPWRC